ncbi:sporulation protein [Halobacillus sp. BBL2006]|uniref:sporulation protein n=1 Tax=Halobacillus sp. BBL2006 TaxID=1543706 RepID=UPI000542A763|nr:sporulation protein [Halobacillus sp. BBL2006]KHE67366.1 sporulation protein [Halobacillus sp. BBL2006]
MITKLLSLLKVGSPKIDLVLDQNEINPGGKIAGSFHLKGGWTSQKIKRLECDLVKDDHGKKPMIIQPVTTVLMSQTIDPKDKKEFPFHCQLPEQLTPSSERISYRLQTKLVFMDDVKSVDHDELIVTKYE